jgi:hypothetical protein
MKSLAPLLQKEMTRKQFITTLGLAALSVAGIGPILKLVFGKRASVSHQFGSVATASGYGHKVIK